MSTSSLQGLPDNENREQAPSHPSPATEIDAIEEDNWLAVDSTVQRPLPRYTLNGLSIPVIQGIDPLTRAQTHDSMVDTTIGMQPVHGGTGRLPWVDLTLQPGYTSQPQHRWMTLESPSGDRNVLGRSNHAHPVVTMERISATHNAMSADSAQLGTTLAFQGVNGRDFRRPFLPFPYSEPQQHQTPEQRMQREQREHRERQQQQEQREVLNRIMRISTDTPFPYSDRPRTSILSLPQSQEQQEQAQQQIRQQNRVIREQQQRQEHQAQTVADASVYAPLPHGTRPRTSILSLPRQQTQREPQEPQTPTLDDTIDVPFPPLPRQPRTQIAPMTMRRLSGSAAPARGPAPDFDSPQPIIGWTEYAQAQARILADAEAQTRARQHAGEASLPGAPAPWEAPAQIHVQTHTSAHVIAQESVRRRRRERVRDWSPPPPLARRERRDTDHRFRLLLSMYHHRAALPTPPSRPLHSQRPRRPRVPAATHSVSGPGSNPNFFSSRSVPADPATALPPPLTRRALEHHAANPVFNPLRLPWNHARFVVRLQRARIRSTRRLAAAAQDAARAALEAERVDAAIQTLALCGALTDSCAVIADIEAEERERVVGRGVRRRERAERGWVGTGRIVTPGEWYELRRALARRAELGERMAFDVEFEEHYGRAMGRWVFDVWVARAAGSVGATDRFGGRGRVGAVWLGDPGESGDGDEMGSDDGIAEFHIVPDGDVADGIGEGWVEWVEGRRNGRFVVNDVFR